jgi:hypothetical protein
VESYFAKSATISPIQLSAMDPAVRDSLGSLFWIARFAHTSVRQEAQSSCFRDTMVSPNEIPRNRQNYEWNCQLPVSAPHEREPDPSDNHQKYDHCRGWPIAEYPSCLPIHIDPRCPKAQTSITWSQPRVDSTDLHVPYCPIQPAFCQARHTLGLGVATSDP